MLSRPRRHSGVGLGVGSQPLEGERRPPAETSPEPRGRLSPGAGPRGSPKQRRVFCGVFFFPSLPPTFAGSARVGGERGAESRKKKPFRGCVASPLPERRRGGGRNRSGCSPFTAYPSWSRKVVKRFRRGRSKETQRLISPFYFIFPPRLRRVPDFDFIFFACRNEGGGDEGDGASLVKSFLPSPALDEDHKKAGKRRIPAPEDAN